MKKISYVLIVFTLVLAGCNLTESVLPVTYTKYIEAERNTGYILGLSPNNDIVASTTEENFDKGRYDLYAKGWLKIGGTKEFTNNDEILKAWIKDGYVYVSRELRNRPDSYGRAKFKKK